MKKINILSMVVLCFIFVASYCETIFADSFSTVSNYFKETFQVSFTNVYWGEFHSHSSYSNDADKVAKADGLAYCYPPWEAYAYARDVQNFDFIGLSDHAEGENLRARPLAHKIKQYSLWQSLYEINKQYNNENIAKGKIFIIFPGWEYTNSHGLQTSTSGYGHKNVIFKDLELSALPEQRYGVDEAATAKELWELLNPYRAGNNGKAFNTALTIIHTPANVGDAEDLSEFGGISDHRTDWEVMDGDFVKHVEIYSKWGNSEGPSPYKYNPINEELIDYVSGAGDPITVRTILYNYWVLGGDKRYLLGFLGGTDNHWGMPGVYNYPSYIGYMPYRGGITGIIANNLNRDDLWTAICQRRTIASSASADTKRNPVLFALEAEGRHLFMGDCDKGASVVRIRAIIPTYEAKIEVLVDGKVVYAIENSNVVDKVFIIEPSKRHYIYVRVLRYEDSDKCMTWTSPIYLEPIQKTTKEIGKSSNVGKKKTTKDIGNIKKR